MVLEFASLGEAMYHYDARIALEELQEDALLPHPVKLRDMILRNQLGPQDAQLLNHEFQDYLTRFGELQKLGRSILEKLATGQRKAS
jgi:hypothetical protein